MKYLHRQIESVVKKQLKQFPAIIVSGPRQSGKSTLLEKTFPDYTYVTFDDPVLREQANSDPNLLLDNTGTPVILDEIQYVPSLLSYIKMRIDQDRHRRGAFLLTGSQQFPLSQTLSETLAGRIGILELLPFSITEATQEPRLKKPLASPIGAFRHACLRGLYPELCVTPKLETASWYGSYARTYLERDIRSIHGVGNMRDFQRCLQLLASRCGQTLNMSPIARDLGVAVNTIKQWISILEASRVLYLLPAYYRNLGKRITKAPKIYFTDCALVTYLTGIHDFEALIKGPLAGPLFENFCVQEAMKIAVSKGLEPRLFYIRTHNGAETDLIVEGPNGELHPFEFKLSKTPSPGLASSLDRLSAVFDTLPLEPGAVVSLSPQSIPLTRRVNALPVHEYFKTIEKILMGRKK
jgi:predicted AAA+ superfamily ATPase